jgi:cobyrinic acid a,c-diamide synthase
VNAYPHSAPRIVVAGLAGDAGKTLVSLALLRDARRNATPTAAFKKGPDYIDAGWLGWAAGRAARNLDTFLMGKAVTARLFSDHAISDGLNLIEGNRGLFDGLDELGTHSTAELAKLLNAPVLLVIDATKVTRTVAALVLGCRALDPAVQIGGIVFNRVAGARQEAVLRKSIATVCDIPVLGVIPKIAEQALLPQRHLGLVTPEEHGRPEELAGYLESLAAERLDTARILEVAAGAPAIENPAASARIAVPHEGLRIGYLKDAPFTFYYPDNLEALERSGARLVPIPVLSATRLPDGLDALYVGGGFPETHAALLAANTGLRGSVRERALAGLPVYAECGGLMFLAQSIRWRGETFPMAAVLPFAVEVSGAPQGHGYVELLVDRPNPYYPVGTAIRGHEFHYSRIVAQPEMPATACAMGRGAGAFGGRDGVLLKNVWASYTHVHAASTPEWAEGLLRAAGSHAARRLAVPRERSYALSAGSKDGVA